MLILSTFFSASCGDVDATVYLLEKGINIRLQDRNGQSAIHYSILNDKEDITDVLIHAGAPLNVQNNDGETPIFIATRQGDLFTVKKLLKYGANPNVCNLEEASPLHVAVANNRKDIAAALLSAGAHINARDAAEETPLHWAVREGNAECVALLLRNYGCHVGAVNEDGETALQLAQEFHMDDVVEVFRSAANHVATPAHHIVVAPQQPSAASDKSVHLSSSTGFQDLRNANRMAALAK